MKSKGPAAAEALKLSTLGPLLNVYLSPPRAIPSQHVPLPSMLESAGRNTAYLGIMEQVHIKDKQAFLEEHYPFTPMVKLTDVFRCLHCVEVIRVKDFKVYRWPSGFLAICCPNAPACDGTVIDWMPLDMGFE